jgi:hypothetical protein
MRQRFHGSDTPFVSLQIRDVLCRGLDVDIDVVYIRSNNEDRVYRSRLFAILPKAMRVYILKMTPSSNGRDKANDRGDTCEK